MAHPHRTAIKDMLERLDRRQALLQEKCAENLVESNGLSPTVASALTRRWTEAVLALKNLDDPAWETAAARFGAWCAGQSIPFEAVMALLHFYKRSAMPLLIREYPGVEGFLEGVLALDEAVALLLGKIPGGYYAAAEIG
ncbi:MAG: hypothetical protein ACE5H9_20110 [Anaerolineae bacterium]